MKTQNVMLNNTVRILSSLKHFFNTNRLFRSSTATNTEKVPLTDAAIRSVQQAVSACLSASITPKCSVNGDDGTTDTGIVSLSIREYEDLVSCLERLQTQGK